MAKRRKKRRGLGNINALHTLRCGGRITLRREPLNRGGYTSGGVYFGGGEKLWSYANEDSWGYLRADTKAVAKKMILAKCPATSGFNGTRKKRRR